LFAPHLAPSRDKTEKLWQPQNATLKKRQNSPKMTEKVKKRQSLAQPRAKGVEIRRQNRLEILRIKSIAREA
jgi:hypothetical protein